MVKKAVVLIGLGLILVLVSLFGDSYNSMKNDNVATLLLNYDNDGYNTMFTNDTYFHHNGKDNFFTREGDVLKDPNDVIEYVEKYLSEVSYDLVIKDVNVINDDYYHIVLVEQDGGMGALELVVAKNQLVHYLNHSTMFWNQKYILKRHSILFVNSNVLSDVNEISEEDGYNEGIKYLSEEYSLQEKPIVFYGYYLYYVLKNGEINGILRVKSDNGTVEYDIFK